MDEGEFETLYRDNWQAVFAYARRRTPGLSEAADVVADVFATAWRRRDAIPDGAHARMWLFGVARYAVANSARGDVRRRRLQTLLLRSAQESAPDPAEIAEASDEAAKVRELVGQLPPNDREVLTLTAWDGLAPSDAAVVLGISPALARVRLRRARIRLRRMLETAPQRAAAAGHVQVTGQPPVTIGETR